MEQSAVRNNGDQLVAESNGLQVDTAPTAVEIVRRAAEGVKREAPPS